MVMIKRMIVDQHHPSRRYRVGFPLLGSLEELEIGLNVFNELDDADFSRYSSPTGEKYRSSSSETGRPAATPLRRGVRTTGVSHSLTLIPTSYRFSES